MVLFTTMRTEAADRARFVEAGADVVVLGEHRVDLAAALAHLSATGIRQLLVEGGGTLVEALLGDASSTRSHCMWRP